MGIPTGSLAAGVEKTLRLTLDAIILRVADRGWATHVGKPDPNALPPDDKSFWVMPTNIRNSPQTQSLGAEEFVTTWYMAYIEVDHSRDEFGTSIEGAFEALGELLTDLTSTVANKGIDGTVDFTDQINVTPFSDRFGDRRYIGFEMDILAHHQLQPIRTS